MFVHNNRDPQDPNIIVWKPIYLINENGIVDLQIREHKLRWHKVSTLKKLLVSSGFEIETVYSGPLKERFKEDVHSEMWFVAIAK